MHSKKLAIETELRKTQSKLAHSKVKQSRIKRKYEEVKLKNEKLTRENAHFRQNEGFSLGQIFRSELLNGQVSFVNLFEPK